MHSYDYPAIAAKGVEAARLYAQIAGVPRMRCTASPHFHSGRPLGGVDDENLKSAKVARQDNEPTMSCTPWTISSTRNSSSLATTKRDKVLAQMRSVTGVNPAATRAHLR